MNRSTRIVVALACLAAASGGGTAYGQLADGSIGTAQVAAPPVDVSASAAVSPEPQVNVNTNVLSSPGGSQTASGSVGTVQVGGGGAQSATGSAGTVQAQMPATNAGVGAAPSVSGDGVDPNSSASASIEPASGGSQTASNSVGTAQVAQPGADADASFTGPLRPDMPDGLLSREAADVAVSVDPAEGGPQTASNSAGTLQIGGGEQTASDSAATGQVAVPRIASRTTAGGPTLAESSFDVVPGGGGTQTADGSAGTMQIGGGGSQTASDSAGTGQVAMPGLSGDGALTRELTGSSAGAAVTPNGGDQLADGSAGTVQVGGNGSQTASDSAGTGQVALPGATAGGTTSDAGGSVTPTGGSQSADDSIGTVQVGGGGGGAATTTSTPGPTSGVAGVTEATPGPSQTGVPGAVPDSTVSVGDPEGALVGYVHGDATLTTWHCGRCGCTTHWSPRDPAYQRMGANLRLFDPAIWEPLPRRFIDGAPVARYFLVSAWPSWNLSPSRSVNDHFMWSLLTVYLSTICGLIWNCSSMANSVS
mgnify:CR=1 FL=1